jgi:hypothetical protein
MTTALLQVKSNTTFNVLMNPVVVLFFVITLVTQVQAQTPGVRNAHGMAYDITLRGMALFAGADDHKVCNDTWLFKNDQWKKLDVAGPPARTFPGFVPTDRGIILFGGNRVLFGDSANPVFLYNDTWRFAKGTWTKINTIHSPDGRSDMSIAYDRHRKRVVLFGGYKYLDDNKTRVRLNDTWEFDGTDWARKSGVSPSPRSGSVMVFHDQLKKIILMGGNLTAQREPDYNGPMWTWDGTHWTPLNSPDSLIFNTNAAYHERENYILRFGGWNGKNRIQETHIFNDGKWSPLSTSMVPAARNHSTLVYHPVKRAFFIYGGHDGTRIFGDLWMFSRGVWSLVHDEPPKWRVENGH